MQGRGPEAGNDGESLGLLLHELLPSLKEADVDPAPEGRGAAAVGEGRSGPATAVPVAPACTHCGARLTESIAWCPRCLEPASAEVGPSTSSPVAHRAPSPLPGVEVPSSGRSAGQAGPGGPAVRLALGVILLNIVVQVATYALARSGNVEPSTAISIGLWVGVAFYGLVFLVTIRGGAAAQVRPLWTIGDPRTSLRRGLAVGGGASLFLVGLQSLALHHLAGDAAVTLVVSEGSMGRVLAAVALFVLIGPVIEELVFRAVVAESLRNRGIGGAVLASSFLFALAHLRPASIVYYTLIGAVLGRLYFRYGLKSSIGAHAAFNGCLVAVAVISVLGPAKTYTIDGATLQLPANWKKVSAAQTGPVQLALRGPSGSELIVLDRSVPTGSTFSPDSVVAAAQQHLLPVPPGASIDRVQTVTYPAGSAVVVTLTENGHAGRVVTMVEHDRAWTFVLATAGSSRASSEFDHMMQTLRLS